MRGQVTQGSNKKDREEHFLTRFKRSYEGFPEGTTEPGENPDFRVYTPTRIVGIELTDYYRIAPASRRLIQEQESLRDQVVARARQRYEVMGGPPLYVSIVFNMSLDIRKRDVLALTEPLVNLVAHAIPDVDGTVVINHRSDQHQYMPVELSSLLIARPPTLTQNFWYTAQADIVPGCTPTEIQAAIDKKRDKISQYRRSVDEIWLLIVLDGTKPSSSVDIPTETRRYVYRSGFDKTFLFENFEANALCVYNR